MTQKVHMVFNWYSHLHTIKKTKKKLKKKRVPFSLSFLCFSFLRFFFLFIFLICCAPFRWNAINLCFTQKTRINRRKVDLTLFLTTWPLFCVYIFFPFLFFIVYMFPFLCVCVLLVCLPAGNLLSNKIVWRQNETIKITCVVFFVYKKNVIHVRCVSPMCACI